MKKTLKLALLTTTLLATSLSVASDMSAWSNKTICRLLTQAENSNNSAYKEEARTRGLVCGRNLTSNNDVKLKSGVALPEKPLTSSDKLYEQFRSNFSSKLPECKGNSKLYQMFSVPFASWDNCWGEVSFKMFTNIPKERQGDQYFGEWQNGRFHGVGAYIYKGETSKKNDIYIGDFASDEPFGKGEYYFFNSKDKKKYVGEVRAGYMNGNGKLYLTNGEVLEGYFISDDFKRGSHVKPDGSKSTGQWRRGKKNGEFQVTDSQGNVALKYYEDGIVVDLAQRAMDKLVAQELKAAKEAEKVKKAQIKARILSEKVKSLEGKKLLNLLADSRFTKTDVFKEAFKTYNTNQPVNKDVKLLVKPDIKYGFLNKENYKSALQSNKYGKYILFSIDKILITKGKSQKITRSAKYKDGTQEVVNPLYFDNVNKLNALYQKLGKRSKSSIPKQYDTYCTNDTMTGISCNTQPNYSANARTEIYAGLIDSFFDALDGIPEMKREAKALEKSLETMSPTQFKDIFKSHEVAINVENKQVIYTVVMTYLDMNSMSYEQYAKDFTRTLSTPTIINESSRLRRVESEILAELSQSLNVKMKNISFKPEAFIKTATPSFSHKVTSLESFVEDILNLEVIDTTRANRFAGGSAKLTSTSSVVSDSNEYFELLGNKEFIKWANSSLLRKALLRGVVKGSQPAIDTLYEEWINKK